MLIVRCFTKQVKFPGCSDNHVDVIWVDVRAIAMNKQLPSPGIETQPYVQNSETQNISMLPCGY